MAIEDYNRAIFHSLVHKCFKMSGYRVTMNSNNELGVCIILCPYKSDFLDNIKKIKKEFEGFLQIDYTLVRVRPKVVNIRINVKVLDETYSELIVATLRITNRLYEMAL